MKKTKYYYVGFLFYGCGCIEHGYGPEPIEEPKVEKIITIINRTNKEYKDNFLDAVCPYKSTSDGKWKISYGPWKINIGSKQILKDLSGIESLRRCPDSSIRGPFTGYTDYPFLLSLDGGKKKVFFGAHDYDVRAEYTEVNKETCRRDFLKWNIHPVWQEKELTIDIYEDRIEFSDLKIKEVKKLKLTIDGEKTQGVDPNTLPLVDCTNVLCGE